MRVTPVKVRWLYCRTLYLNPSPRLLGESGRPRSVEVRVVVHKVLFWLIFYSSQVHLSTFLEFNLSLRSLSIFYCLNSVSNLHSPFRPSSLVPITQRYKVTDQLVITVINSITYVLVQIPKIFKSKHEQLKLQGWPFRRPLTYWGRT